MNALLLSIVVAAAPADTPVELSAGYFGVFATHPGAFVGLEATPLQAGAHALLLGGRAGGYHQAQNHTGLFAGVEFGYRITAPLGLYGEVLAGYGAHHTLLSGPVYDEDAALIADLGRTTAQVGASLGAGYRFRDLPITRVFTRLEGNARAPFNRTWRPQIAFLVGVAFRLGEWR